MNIKHTLLLGAVAGLFFAAPTMAASLTDQYDPYVTTEELRASPEMPTRSEERITDLYDPFILSHEVEVKVGCPNPANVAAADQYDPFVTLAKIDAVAKSQKC